MSPQQMQLRFVHPTRDRLREFRRGEQDAFTGQAKGRGTADYDAGFRLGLEERASHIEIQRQKARDETSPARLHPLALRRLLAAR